MSRRAVESLGDTVASLPPREATLVGFLTSSGSSEAFRKMGASRLYSHQLEAYERVRAGENVVVATATASGKSLCYKIPAFQNALGRAKSRRGLSLSDEGPGPGPAGQDQGLWAARHTSCDL